MSIKIDVAPTNPGQFFACCGLFELADRLWPGTEGWFEGNLFLMEGRGGLTELLRELVNCHLTNSMTKEQHQRFEELSEMSSKTRQKNAGFEDEYKDLGKRLRESAIVIDAPFKLVVNWFLDDSSGGSRFKTWAGQQSVLSIARSMKDALKSSEWRTDYCLIFSANKCGLPFNFDSDLGGQGGAIDIGFSFDPLAASSLTRIETMARPALELLAFIGLQRFRPREFQGENRFRFSVWNRPLPVAVAAVAAASLLPISQTQDFEFRLLYRTKYLKSFLPAVPLPGGSNE